MHWLMQNLNIWFLFVSKHFLSCNRKQTIPGNYKLYEKQKYSPSNSQDPIIVLCKLQFSSFLVESLLLKDFVRRLLKKVLKWFKHPRGNHSSALCLLLRSPPNSKNISVHLNILLLGKIHIFAFTTFLCFIFPKRK